MNRRAEVSFHEAAEAWAERNQRWLSERFACWCERIEQRIASGDDDSPPAPPGDETGFEPAAIRIGALFGLSVFEREVLVLAAGVEIDTALRATVARAQGIPTGSPVRLAFSLALAVLPEPHWDALSPSGPLRHWLLVDLDATDGYAQALLRIDEPVLHSLTGVAAHDERLNGIAKLDATRSEDAPHELASRIAAALRGNRHALVMLGNAGQDASRRRTARSLARSAFAQFALRTLWVDASAVSAESRDVVEIARRIDREAALAGAGVALALDAEPSHHGVRLVGASSSPLVVLGSLTALQLADVPERKITRLHVPLERVSPQTSLPPALQRAADRALQQFRVEPAILEQALASTAAIEHEGAEAAVWDALRESARGGLDALAQRVASRATFDDLVLPPGAAAQLREISSQLCHRDRVYEEWGFGEHHDRGLGIAALFVGESGTGKTLAAEAIANEARLDLYRVDLASVVSKYIGETEKNLARVFDAAEASGAVLLFDEADALFGKRSEVKDSHDRYANIEVAYLLQRIESYRGLAILTSNFRSALDRAFLRRIRFVVQFPFPDEAARAEIWRRQFPARAPLGDLDVRALARLQLAGGHIRSVALNAAFHAAARGEAIGQGAVITAAQAEYAKLERSAGDALAHAGRVSR